MTEWRKSGKRGFWDHRCRSSGKILLVSRSHLGIYRVEPDEDEPPQKLLFDNVRDRWEIDEFAGCQWCQGFPPELESLAAYLRSKPTGSGA